MAGAAAGQSTGDRGAASEPDGGSDGWGEAYENLVIREVRVTGLKGLDEQGVWNLIRSKAGQPLNPETVRADVRQLTRMGRFSHIDAKFQVLADNSVVLTYAFSETPIIKDVQAVGNRQVADQDIAAEVSLLAETPVDEFQLGSAARRIQELYRKKGYYRTQVSIEQEAVEGGVIVLFKINEGQRVKITDIRFEGNTAFSAKQIRPEIKTKTQGLFDAGAIDDITLDQDVATIIGFYRDRGYLDVRADREVRFAPSGTEAIVTFLIDEGPRYTLRSVKAVSADAKEIDGKQPAVLSPAQLAGLMQIKPGDVYSVDKINKSVDEVRNAYAKMGYVDAEVGRRELRDEQQPLVDLLLVVNEGKRYRTGLVTIVGNDITQDKVIRRLVSQMPDEPLDNSARRRTADGRLVTETERRINDTRLFAPGSVKYTVLPEDPASPGYRDVLIEVEETNTGSLNFGASVGSDGGLNGIIRFRQENFDIKDYPESFSEFFSGRAFRGAGQTFDITLSPGTELQQYSIGLTEPYLFETEYTGTVRGIYQQREYTKYDEDRLSARLSVGRRFGERWIASATFRAENINIRQIDEDSPTDVFAVEGDNQLMGLGLTVSRSSIDSRFRPTRGHRFEASVERVGGFGDYDFTKLGLEQLLYLPINEDFLGRRTTLAIKNSIAYIPEGEDDAPVFERYYLGGRSLRGFNFRTVSPKGIRNDTKTLGDDPVGGTWSFFLGAEVEQPLFEDFIAMAFFIDSGTVTNDVGFDDYRVSAGFGLRLRIEALSAAPLAFDFGFPIVKHFGDEERVFSFFIDLPF